MAELPVGAGSPEFLALLAELDAKAPGDGPSLVVMYRAAMHELAHRASPDWAALVAHEMRELIEKFGDGEGIRRAPSSVAKDKLVELRDRFESARDREEDPTLAGSPWDAFVAEMQALPEWLRAHSPTRRQRYTALVRALQASKESLPPEEERQLVDALEEIDRYFKDVAHHARSTTEAELAERIRGLEALALARRSAGPDSDRRRLP